MEVCRYTSNLELSMGHCSTLTCCIESCRFEHPRDLGRTDNRFAALQTKESSSRDSFGRAHSDGINLYNMLCIVIDLKV